MYPESEWGDDLGRMRDAGMNLVRIGDVHGSWDRIEPQEGHLRIDALEQFYAAAAQYGINVLLSTGVSCPPLWLARKYPDVPILSSRGEPYPLAASYHWACIHHPGFVSEARSYVEALARFAANQPNHFGWQISNEVGFPFMPARDRDELGLYCYCSHSKARFREWMQAKYGTLEAVSGAWTWSTTAYWYNDWAEVDPPEVLPVSWSGVTRWIDWRLFWQEAFAQFARWQHDLIHQHDPDHPTSVNTFNFKRLDRFGTFTGLDQWRIASQVDHIGYDLYPGSGDKLSTRPEHTSMFLDHGRSVSRAAGSDFWLHEMESGPIGGWILGPDHNTGPADIWRNGLEALGHDSKLILYMPWKEWDYQPLRWGALADLEGNPTERAEAAAQLGRTIQANAAFLRTAHVPRGEVALLESKPNAIFFRGVEQEEILFAAQRGAYRAFWEMGFRVDFVSPSQILDGMADSYPVICLPLMGAMGLETAEALGRYVTNGGRLIGFARCGTVDDRGWYHRRLPIPGLREAFGLTRVEADDQRQPTVLFDGRAYAGAMNRDLVTPDSETEVLGEFDDGWPAVTLAHHGRGQGLYIATQADSGYLQADDPLLRAVLTAALDRLGIGPEITLEYQGRTIRELDPHLLEGKDRTTILITSYLVQDTRAVLQMALRGRRAERVDVGLLEKTPADWVQDDTHLEVRLEMRKEVGEAIDIYWQSQLG